MKNKNVEFLLDNIDDKSKELDGKNRLVQLDLDDEYDLT
jgi:hypothetical protein